jgi:PIN domain
MIIVLDTNILYKSPLKNPSFVALFDLLSHSENDTLVIPQLVIDEAGNKCREAIAKIQRVLKQQSQEFQQWTGERLSLLLTDDEIQSTIANV